MENYFNYFTDIEEHFWKKRGTAILLTTLDWALIDTLKQANIPIGAVLRGIDRAFEKHDQRKAKTRAVNSLAYCHQAILEVAGEMERGELPHQATPPPFPTDALAVYLDKNATAVANAAEKLTQHGRIESGANLQAIASSLHEQAEAARQAASPPLQELEQRMSVLEEKMFGILKQTCPEEALIEIRMERDRQMAPYRSKMAADQVRQLETQFEMRKLLELAELPRLSLFYL